MTSMGPLGRAAIIFLILTIVIVLLSAIVDSRNRAEYQKQIDLNNVYVRRSLQR